MALLGDSHLLTKELMQQVQVDCKLSSLGGSQIAFRVHHNVQVIALIGKEW